MSTDLLVALKPVRALFFNGAIGGGASVGLSAPGSTANKIRVEGLKIFKGNFHCTTAAAAGFPRVRQSADGVTWSRIDVIPQDGGQPDFQYPFDALEIVETYASVEYTQGAAAGVLRAEAEALPE